MPSVMQYFQTAAPPEADIVCQAAASPPALFDAAPGAIATLLSAAASEAKCPEKAVRAGSAPGAQKTASKPEGQRKKPAKSKAILPAAEPMEAAAEVRSLKDERENLLCKWTPHEEKLQRLLSNLECNLVDQKTFLAMAYRDDRDDRHSKRSASLPVSLRPLPPASFLSEFTPNAASSGATGISTPRHRAHHRALQAFSSDVDRTPDVADAEAPEGTDSAPRKWQRHKAQSPAQAQAELCTGQPEPSEAEAEACIAQAEPSFEAQAEPREFWPSDPSAEAAQAEAVPPGMILPPSPTLLNEGVWHNNVVFMTRVPALPLGASGEAASREMAQSSSDVKIEWLLQNALYSNSRMAVLEAEKTVLEQRVAVLEAENIDLRARSTLPRDEESAPSEPGLSSELDDRLSSLMRMAYANGMKSSAQTDEGDDMCEELTVEADVAGEADVAVEAAEPCQTSDQEPECGNAETDPSKSKNARRVRKKLANKTGVASGNVSSPQESSANGNLAALFGTSQGTISQALASRV